MADPFVNQIQNRNFLAPVGFKFTLAKISKRLIFFQTLLEYQSYHLELPVQPSYLKDIDIPGEKLTFGDLTIRFLVDENMDNYMAVHNWLKGIGFPETPQQFKDQTTDSDGLRDEKEVFSDGSLHILNSNFQDVAIVKFNDLFPVGLTSLEFDATETDINYFTAEVVMRYTVYSIFDKDGRTLL